MLSDRYVEGVGTDARYNNIFDLEYVRPRNKVITVDRKNECLREFNRQTLLTERLAGQCGVSGNLDGYRLDAKQDRLHTVIYDEASNSLYLTEQDLRKIKVLNFTTERIETWKALTFSGIPKALSIPPEGVSAMLAINGDSIVQLAGSDFVEIEGVQIDNSEFKKIITLTSSMHVLADHRNGMILADLSTKSNNSLVTLCPKDDYDPKDHILNCSLNGDESAAMTIVNSSISFVLGEAGEMKLWTLKGKGHFVSGRFFINFIMIILLYK